MKRFLMWLLRLISFGTFGKEPAQKPLPPAEPEEPEPEPAPPPEPEPEEPTPEPAPPPEPEPEEPKPPPKSIVPLLIYPSQVEGITLDEIIEVGEDRYYISSPWEVPAARIDESIRVAEDWLAGALGTRIPWSQVRTIKSQYNLADWRRMNISLIRVEVETLGLPWTGDYVYLAFVRGMGGYAGGIRYENGNAGYAMVGDICLEAICEYPEPSAGSVLFEGTTFPPNSYSVIGQTSAFIHEALHGLDLPHPDGWPEEGRPDWDETLVGSWWNMPDFGESGGLTQMEIERVLQWTAPTP